ncbi:MAG: 3-deoxy-7-phosphoheptulonate synthase class II [Planctomycetota bacterium]
MTWSPDSWKQKAVTQLPRYDDAAELDAVVRQLSALPPLVTSWEIESLRSLLAMAGRGEAFLLQGGDCSENFEECTSENIADKLKILLQMSLVMIQGSMKPVIRVGRFAGQYAKPRSSDTETRDGVELPSYRGDMVNGADFTPESRRPDPQRLLRAYERSALTLNFIRSLVEGGFADLHHPEYWDLDFVRASRSETYRDRVAAVERSLRFMETIAGPRMGGVLSRVDFYSSHEGLNLHYEQAQTRRPPRRSGWYNLSTHLPWIGDRTRDLDGAHIEYFRGIENPVGVKIGPSIEPKELITLCERLNPKNELGRLTLIHRFGSEQVEAGLPRLIEAVQSANHAVVWCCDPMHGNTESTSSGLKTRNFDRILKEIQHAIEIHRRCGSVLGGVHFEMTGDNVTECIGGAAGLSEDALQASYRSQVDPRLNGDQALEMALLLADSLR